MQHMRLSHARDASFRCDCIGVVPHTVSMTLGAIEGTRSVSVRHQFYFALAGIDRIGPRNSLETNRSVPPSVFSQAIRNTQDALHGCIGCDYRDISISSSASSNTSIG